MIKKVILLLAVASAGMSTVQGQRFTHPGIPFSASDLQTLKANIDSNREPWKSGYAMLAADWRSQLGYTMQGPFATVTRNPHQNLNQWRNDMTAVYNLARMWYFTGNEQYAQKARDILIAWADTQTVMGGMEANLDLGDYAFRFVGGAEILRGTWPGWTQADTDKVKNLFTNVYWTLRIDTLGPTNKGSLSLAAGTAIAAFCDDQAMMDKALRLYRTCASTGLRNSLSNGEHGETGRDQGHSYGHILAMSFAAEVFWKQGIDVFSELDNRLLAMGEYYCRFNLGVPTSFVPMGTTDEYYMSIWDKPGYAAEPAAFNILKSAYVVRKGLSAPWIERKLETQPMNMDAFMYLKSADTTTATPPQAIAFPSGKLASTGLTSADIGGASPTGSSTYSNGIWTVNGQGNDIWTHGAQQFHYLYKQVTGDGTIIAKVESVQNINNLNKAGVMIRSDLNATPACSAWVALRPNSTVETFFHGWSEMIYGANWEAQGYGLTHSSWWVKVERFGNLVTTYASPDGTSWTALVSARCDNLGTSPYYGICVSSQQPGTLSKATFSNVSVTGGNGAAPVAPPAAPLSLFAAPGEGRVPLRWTESFGATSYKVKRATTRGGPYTTIATVTNPSHVDATVSNGITYHYVVSAVNAKGEGPNSAHDSVTPHARLVNIVGSGTASASHNSDSAGEGSARAFDLNPGSKWFNGNAGQTGWLQYDLGADGGSAIAAYEIISANDVPGRDPKNWQFQGSNDGSAWTTLDTRSDQTFRGFRTYPRRYPISGSARPFRYYRLNVTANHGDPSGLQLGELSLLKPAARKPVVEPGNN